MTDVFEDWKKNKFIVVESALVDIGGTNLIILTDVAYWNENYDVLHEWCEDYNAEVRGMTVTLSDESLTAFCLRWS